MAVAGWLGSQRLAAKELARKAALAVAASALAAVYPMAGKEARTGGCGALTADGEKTKDPIAG